MKHHEQLSVRLDNGACQISGAEVLYILRWI